MQGTPVKSCSSTRAGVNATSRSGVAFGSQAANASICSRVTLRPSSLRSRFSSRMRSVIGSRASSSPSVAAATSRS